MKTSSSRLLLAWLVTISPYVQLFGQSPDPLTDPEKQNIKCFAERFEISDKAVESFLERHRTGNRAYPGEETIYDRIRAMMRVNDPDFYISPFPISNNQKTFTDENRMLAEEGSWGYVLEMRLAQRFPIVQPRYIRSDKWIRWKLLTVNYDFLYRLAQHSEVSTDSPGLPMNTKFGITLLETAIPLTLRNSVYFKKDKSKSVNKDFTTEVLGSGIFDRDNLIILVPRLDFVHYSNGQRENALFVPISGVPIRNNYANGNFSTNYLQGQFDFTTLNKNPQLFNFYIGYRVDFGMGKLLSFDPNQKGRYGCQRLVTGIAFRSGPMLDFDAINQYYDSLKQFNREFHTESEIEAFDKGHKPPRRLSGMYEMYGRIMLEQITGGTSDFDQYKTGITGQLGVTFLNMRSFGLMLQGHYGRDYLNIRYDIPVFNFLLAATFNINTYSVSEASKLKAQLTKFRREPVTP